MRTKSSAHHIPTVIDLTNSQDPQQEPTTSTAKKNQTPAGKLKKNSKPVREKNASTAKVRKVSSSNTSTAGKKPSIKRKRNHQQDAPAQVQQQQQQQHASAAGMYQFDLTDMIRQKLKMLLEPPMYVEPPIMMAAVQGNSFIPYDPRYRWGTTAGASRLPVTAGARMMNCTPSYKPCSVPGCSQEAISASLSRHHHSGRLPRTAAALAQSGRRFSIFRNVELMAQSSCVSNQ